MQDTVLTSSLPPCDACAAEIHCFGGRCPCCCREPEPGRAGAKRILCAHADQDGKGAHWLEPGETCPAAQLAADAARTERDRQDWDQEHAGEAGQTRCPSWCTGEHGRPRWASEERWAGEAHWHLAASCPPWCTGHPAGEPEFEEDGHCGHASGYAEVQLSLAEPFEAIDNSGADATLPDSLGVQCFQHPESTVPVIGINHGATDEWLPEMTPAEAVALAGALVQAAGRIEPAAVADGGKLAAIRATLAELGGVGSIAGKLLAEAIERIDQLANSSRTVSGIEPDGSVHITVRDVPLVVAGLADAADLLEHRAGQFCPDCEKHPAELCDEHAADLGQADAYRSMLAKLTERAAEPALAGIYRSAIAKLTGSAPASSAGIARPADPHPDGCPPWCDVTDDEDWGGFHHACFASSVGAAPYVVQGMTHYESARVILMQGDGGEPVICMEMPANPDGSADGIPMTLAEAEQVSDSLTALIAAARGVCPDCGVPADDGRACTGDVLILGRALAEATKPAADQP